MLNLWKQKSRQTIGELSAEELVRYAFNVFLYQGRTQTGARLIYQALTKDPSNADALRSLFDYLNVEGTEKLAATVLEYGLSPHGAQDEAGKKQLANHLYAALWLWGLAKDAPLPSGEGNSELYRPTEFVLNEEGYRAFIEPIIEQSGSLEKAFKGAHNLLGIAGNLIQHRKQAAPDMDELYHTERFIPTNDYEHWLRSTTEELDEMEAARQKGRWYQPKTEPETK